MFAQRGTTTHIVTGTLFLLLCISSAAQADTFRHSEHSTLQLSRYSVQLPRATTAQQDPLQAVIKQVRFSSKVTTVGAAIESVLNNSGYQLAKHHPDPAVLELLKLTLPAIHRRMGPLTVEQSLKTLAGEPWQLVVDPVHRLISFQLPQPFCGSSEPEGSVNKAHDDIDWFASLGWED